MPKKSIEEEVRAGALECVAALVTAASGAQELLEWLGTSPLLDNLLQTLTSVTQQSSSTDYNLGPALIAAPSPNTITKSYECVRSRHELKEGPVEEDTKSEASAVLGALGAVWRCMWNDPKGTRSQLATRSNQLLKLLASATRASHSSMRYHALHALELISKVFWPCVHLCMALHHICLIYVVGMEDRE